ncbi:MAG: hypothetical protein GKR99_03595 [Rhodobacteraceae bacterium]|nr:hypothetical protein [Paracoccaceae bacterium]
MTRSCLAAALVASFAFVALPAATLAQSNPRNCGPRDAVLARLSEGYGESRQSAGLAAQGQMVEVFAASGTGTWTITVTNAAGLMCLVASGEAFERFDEIAPVPGSDS